MGKYGPLKSRPYGLNNLLFIVTIEAKTCAAEFGGELIHLPADGLVNDAGIDLGRGEFGMAEHLAD